ncbi:MAG: zf-HC2 domain-containing protein [Gemmatimonadales bacterium]|nr:zf-HC2 domain-containing protein [Gemmatimonadales bacterium]
MRDHHNAKGQPLGCHECSEGLQDYLDGTLDKQQSLRIFLHLRECPGCQAEHDRLHGLFEMLETMPDHPLPEGFDEAILASVPYDSYRQMEPIRRERVAVFLEEEFLPAWVRSPVTRLTGVGVAAVSVASIMFLDGAGLLFAVAAIGVAPQVVVSLQGMGRRLSLNQRRAEG